MHNPTWVRGHILSSSNRLFCITTLQCGYIYIYIWTLTKRRKKKLDGNYPRMLCAILNKSWKKHLFKITAVWALTYVLRVADLCRLAVDLRPQPSFLFLVVIVCKYVIGRGFVIYKRVVARKIRLTSRFSLFHLLNTKNKQADEISGRLRRGYLFCDKQLLWSALTVLSGDALSTVDDSTARVTSACPIFMFPTSNTGSRKYYLWKKIIG